jgi:hypothetical protein
MTMMDRRTFTLVATAAGAGGLLHPLFPSAPAGLLAEAKQTLPDGVPAMLHCLDQYGDKIPGMSQPVTLRWVGDEYRVMEETVFYPDHACIVDGFALEPFLGRGTVDRPYYLAGGDLLQLSVTLAVAAGDA